MNEEYDRNVRFPEGDPAGGTPTGASTGDTTAGGASAQDALGPQYYTGEDHYGLGFESKNKGKKPGYNTAGYGNPGYDNPGYGAPGYDNPGYDNPGYDNPGYGAPGYDNAGYGAPGYDDPSYDPSYYARQDYNSVEHAREGAGMYTPPFYPERYICRISSTLLTIVKVLEGLGAGIAAVGMISMILKLKNQVTQAAPTLLEVLRDITAQYGIPDEVLNQITGEAIVHMKMPLGILAGGSGIFLIAVFLIVWEAVALLMLRIRKRGGTSVRIIHIIHMVVCILEIFMTVAMVFLAVSYLATTSSQSGNNAMKAGGLVVIIIGILTLIGLVIDMIYHKDIAMAMSTVAYETKTRRPATLRKTHLSGISFLKSLPSLLVVVAGIAALVADRTGNLQLPGDVSIPKGVYIGMMAMPIWQLIKQWSVCFCNRNLKKARQTIE